MKFITDSPFTLLTLTLSTYLALKVSILNILGFCFLILIFPPSLEGTEKASSVNSLFLVTGLKGTSLLRIESKARDWNGSKEHDVQSKICE